MPAETETARRDVDARRATRGAVTESLVVANMTDWRARACGGTCARPRVREER